MGIFTDKCDTLIDPSTGRALSGAALEQAKTDKNWPRCDNRVHKAARFCNKCGSSAPRGWWQCPSCKKWIGGEAQFCSHCNTPLYPDERSVMAGGAWRKDAELFAQRFEIGDINRLLQNDLQVQEGTIALLLDGGAVCGILESGRHNKDSIGGKKIVSENMQPRSLVMIDIGDIILPLRVDGLRTMEHHPIEFYGEVILQFGNTSTAAVAFLENALKDARHLSYDDLRESLQGVLRTAINSMCAASSLDDLVRDPERRVRLHDTMTRIINDDIKRKGLQLIRVSSAEFTGDEYDEYVQRLGEVDIKRRELEYVETMRKLQNQAEMDAFKDADALRTYKALIDNEFEVSQATRDREWQLLKRNWEHDNIRHQQLLEIEQSDHTILKTRKMNDFAREENVENAGTDVKIQQMRFAQEMKEARDALELRKAKDAHELELKEKDAKRRAGMKMEERLMDVDDPVLRRQLFDVLMAERNRTMTPEQILAEAAMNSPAAAEALAKMSDRSKQNAEQVLAEMKKLYADANERQDKNLKTMLEPAIEAAKRQPGQPQTIVH